MQPPHEPPDDLPSVRLLTWLSLCALLLAAFIAVAVVLLDAVFTVMSLNLGVLPSTAPEVVVPACNWR